jgi:membrane-bound inhibitor of C-type lysozyme
MKNNALNAVWIALAALIVIGAAYFLIASRASAPGTVATSTAPVAAATSSAPVNYSCDAGKRIIAEFTDTTAMLRLSDGRSITLPQVMSGSGIRYEQGAGTSADLLFAGKGSNADFTEGTTTTYANCIAGLVSSGTGTATFTDQGKTFSFSYPPSVTVSGGGASYTQDWMNNSSELGLILVKATLPASFEPSTNFVDAKLTVGTSAIPAAVSNCLKAPASGTPVRKSAVTINGVSFTRYVSSDAGAGNRYQTTSYRTVKNNQCYALEYTIHSSAIGNYSPSQGITAFDQVKVQSVLEGIVQSFTLLS